MNSQAVMAIDVLVVEDEPGARLLARHVLAAAGMNAHAVSGVGEATDMLARRGFSVVLLDYVLPDGSAWEVVDAAHARVPRVPVILLSAAGDEAIATEAMRRGVADYLKKSGRIWDEVPAAIERVTREARLAEGLRRREAQLAEAQRIAHIGSWEHDLDSGRTIWSAELLRICGMAGVEPEPTFAEFLSLVLADDRARLAAVTTSASEQGTFSLECRIVRPDGESRHVMARGERFADGDGRLTRQTGTIQDITERRQMESRLLLADRLVSVGTLAAGVAHEINNPLTYVIANLDFVAEGLRAVAAGAPVSVRHDLIEVVAEARLGAERVRKIVRDVRTFARTDEETRQPIGLRHVIEVAINMTFKDIRHRACLVKDYGQTPLVEADEARLAQVFVNLLRNAAQSIPEGNVDGNQIRVVTSTDQDGAAVIEIRDTGCGIPDHVKSRIFDPFFTTKAVGVGTGLGLSICHGIIAAIGGSIDVGNAPGRGTSVRVILPKARPVTPDGEAAQSARPLVGGRRGRVLVVDDEPLVLSVLARLLIRDHDVVPVSDPREALNVLRRGDPFDVVLCDLMMPDLTGMDLYGFLLRERPALAASMVFLTGGAFTPGARAFLDDVPNPRMEKPFDSSNLRALVRGLVH